MKILSFSYWLYIIFLMAGLSGCSLSRPEGSANDINALVPPAAAQTNPTTISLQPASSQLELGTTTSIEIRIDNVTNLTAVDIELRFDPAIVQVIDSDPDKNGVQIQPGDFLAPNFVVTNEVDNATGVIRYIVTQIDAPPSSGSGRLASIPLIGANPGTASLTFSIVKLANSEAQPIDSVKQPAQVTVNPVTGEPLPTATAVPSTPVAVEPTATPGEPVPAVTPDATVVAVEPTVTPVIGQPTATVIISELTATPIGDGGGISSTATAVGPEPYIDCTPVPKGPTPDPNKCPTLPEMPVNGTLGFCYRVEYGETIDSLSKKFGVSSHTLNIVNDLWPRDMVYAHMVLFIPEQLGNGPNYYRVQQGDTLHSVADLCRINAWLIAKVNHLEPDATLQPGDIIEIPIPPYPPPARFNYPTGPIPVIPPPIAPYSAP